MIVGKNTWISVLLSQDLQTLADEGKWRLDLKTLPLEVTKCEIKKNTVFWSFFRLTQSLQVSFFISTIPLPELHQKLLNSWSTYMGKNQPRPQGFSLKKWVVAGAHPFDRLLVVAFSRPTHFLREKLWGREWGKIRRVLWNPRIKSTKNVFTP